MSHDFSKVIIIIVHNVHHKLIIMSIPCCECTCYYVVVCIKGHLNLMVKLDFFITTVMTKRIYISQTGTSDVSYLCMLGLVFFSLPFSLTISI